MTNRWGPWTLSDDGRKLVYRKRDAGNERALNLLRCGTAAEVLDTIYHEAAGGARGDVDDAYLAGLVRALGDVLHPIPNLCLEGKPAKISNERLNALLDEAAAPS